MKEIAYDGFGNIVSDSAPSFELPFAFAGGLADPGTGLVASSVVTRLRPAALVTVSVRAVAS